MRRENIELALVCIYEDSNNKSGSAWLEKYGYRLTGRINKCEAYYFNRPDSPITLILSYDTIVGGYDKENKILYSFGRYTRTTYSHIRKFRNDYTDNGYNTEEHNLELCNWFK